MIAIDMKMPDCCLRCPFLDKARKLRCLVAAYKGRACTVKPGLEGRPEWCPLMEVKEYHG